MPLTITSSAFAPNGPIPVKHTCDGANTSPPLAWAGVPPGTKSLALIVDDPDAPDPKAPTRTFVHWVMYDLPPTVAGIDDARPAPDGVKHGRNDQGTTGYTGPCPPIGRHRYFFKLYALDVILGELRQPTKAGVEAAMRGHVIAQAEVVGTYERPTTSSPSR